MVDSLDGLVKVTAENEITFITVATTATLVKSVKLNANQMVDL